MKAYTDIEQSKQLSKILPVYSADMYYPVMEDNTPCKRAYPKDVEYLLGEDIECWSLSALFDVLNKTAYLINKAGIVELTNWSVSILNCGKIENCYADNPIDACVEMIIKLHEKNLL